MIDARDANLLALTTQIMSVYLSHNRLPSAEIPEVMQAVFAAFKRLSEPLAGSDLSPIKSQLTPAYPIRKSVTPDMIFSLEDGQPYKMLKRHLRGLGMTPDQYRAKWGLPADYPMSSASHSAMRKAQAKRIGLGRRAAAEPPLLPLPAPKRRGRPPAAAQ